MVLLVVGGLGCLGTTAMAGLVGLGYLAQKTAKPLPVADAERRMLVTAEDFEERYENFEVLPGLGKLAKRREIDGMLVLDYVYDASEHGMYLTSELHQDSSPVSAAATYGALRVGSGIGFAMSSGSDLKVEERADLFSWGDESYSALITNKGNPVGNIFIARKGRQVYLFTVVGMYFGSKESMAELLLPKLEGLAPLTTPAG